MYEKDARSRIKSAWRNFQSGQAVSTDDVRPIILESWKRCKQFGSDPINQTVKIVPQREIQKKLKENSSLLKAAHDYLINLYEKILHREGIVVLSDAEGIILFAVGSSGFAQHRK